MNKVSGFSYPVDDGTSLDPLNDISVDLMSESGCVMVNVSAFQKRHNESKDLVTNTASNIVNNINHTIVLPIFFFVGFPSNILNLVVFFKHGLKQRINLCLFCLSLLDLLLLSFGFFFYSEGLLVEDFTSSYKEAGYIMKIIVNNHLIGFYSGFNWASQFVSVVISVERCLCVVWPLRSAVVLKTKTIGIVLLCGSLLLIGGRFVAAEKYHIECMVDVATGIEFLHITSGQFFRTHQEIVDIMEGLVYGVVLHFTMVSVIITATTVTAIRLKQSVQFQRQSSSSALTMSTREIAVTRMLIYLSIQFIILMTPNILLRVSILFFPELKTSGNWANLYFFLTAFVEMFASLNSSINIWVYYFLGSKYRETVHEMLGMCIKAKSKKDLQAYSLSQ